jgi:hypothetical protein
VRDLVIKYLKAVFPPGSKGYFAVCSAEPERKSGGMLSRHFRADAIEEAADYIISEDTGALGPDVKTPLCRNTYVTLCAHGADLGPYKRGTRAEKVSAAVLWVDIDRKGPGHAANDLPETVEDLVHLLRAVEFEPSFVVSTGGGWHAYWRLTAPLALDADGGREPGSTRADFQKLAVALQRRIGEAARVKGWHLDSTSDLTRVLRPVGTHNHKPGRTQPCPVCRGSREAERPFKSLSPKEPCGECAGAGVVAAPAPLVEFLVDPDDGASYDYRILERAFEVQEDKLAKLFGGAPTVSPGVAEGEDTDALTPGAAGGWDGDKTIAEIKDKIARTIKSGAHPDREEILTSFVEGRSWAQPGARDATAQRLVSWLAFYTGGEGDIDAILEMAAPSLSVMDAEAGGVTEAWFAEKLGRALSDARRVAEQTRAAAARFDERIFANARGRHQEVPRTATQTLPLGAPEDPRPTVSTAAGTTPAGPLRLSTHAASGDGVVTAPATDAPGPVLPGGVVAVGGAGGEPMTAGSTATMGNTALALVPAPAGGYEPAVDGPTYYTRAELEEAAADQSSLSGVVCTLYDLKQRLIIQKGESFYHLKRAPNPPHGDGMWRYGEPLQRGELDNAIPEDFRLLPEQIPVPVDVERDENGAPLPASPPPSVFGAISAPSRDAPDGSAVGGATLAGTRTQGEPFFSWHAFKADGTTRRKTVKEVLAELATVARGEVIYDLRIPRSYLDPRTGTFYVAACPVKPITPEYNATIDRWLRTFGESEADREKWLDFCATITDLRYPTCGVFLSGPPSTGKTMFATGAARLWADDFTNMDDVFASSGFNSGLSKCPLIVADESLPSDGSGHTVSTKLLRRLIGSDRRTLNRKYMSPATIVGAVRCLFLGNDENMLGQGDESLGSDALEAVAGRFLHIRVTREAREFLVSIGGRGGLEPGPNGEPRPGTRGWVDDNMIAKHLLWLRDNRRVKYGHRFIVDGHESKVSQLLATNGVIPGLVCEWLARFLSKPREVMLRNRSVVLGGGKFWVKGQALLDSWGDVIKSDRGAPTLGKVNKALGGISFPREDGDREYVDVPNGERRRIRYWKIRPEVILEYAEQNQIGDDPEAMRALIEGPEVELKGTAVSVAFANTKQDKRGDTK